MAQILVRGLDDALVARLKERARENHRSLQGESSDPRRAASTSTCDSHASARRTLSRQVKAILEEAAAQATNAEVEAILDRWQRHWQQKGKTFSDSAELIREDRDSR